MMYTKNFLGKCKFYCENCLKAIKKDYCYINILETELYCSPYCASTNNNENKVFDIFEKKDIKKLEEIISKEEKKTISLQNYQQ